MVPGTGDNDDKTDDLCLLLYAHFKAIADITLLDKTEKSLCNE